ncbi:MAG: trypsin-like peptidase domain-containing protein [Calditrichae bacterium]|nr:trypsin-like peptidase domain-containing protein [Calditrichota bacterium]MCB9059281.1 trypsin-like peptidase domain-containing protein [Calditrichia bacterium]
MAANIEDVRQLLKTTKSDLFKKSNVVATGVGYKTTNGKLTGDLSIVCSVESKKSPGTLSASDLLPQSMDGIPVDVNATGVIHALAQDPKLRYRPASGGVSIGHYLITAGTFGVTVLRDGKRFILSNNHVLANSNDASIGDEILQPGPYDGGSRPNDVIGVLKDFVQINYDGSGGDPISDCPIANSAASVLNAISAAAGRKSRLKAVYEVQAAENLVDAALCEPSNQNDISNDVVQVGAPNGIAEASLGMSLQKFGRTTEYTTGTVLQIDVTSQVSYGTGKTATFVDQIMAGAMSAGGDSGSAIFNTNNQLVGLLFAGSSSTTIINRIQNVFELLNVSLP